MITLTINADTHEELYATITQILKGQAGDAPAAKASPNAKAPSASKASPVNTAAPQPTSIEAPAQAATVAPVLTAATTASASTNAAPAKLEYKTVSDAVLKLVGDETRGGKEKAVHILASFGVAKAKDLAEDRWPELYAALNDAPVINGSDLA